MSFSPTRSIVFLLIGLPIAFVLAALAFVATGRAINGAALVPFGLALAAIGGVFAGFWKTGK